MLTQMSVATCVRAFSDRAIRTVLKEFSQLDNKGVEEQLHPQKMASQEKKDTLRAICFLKEKRRGRLKCRICANGSKQRPYITKEAFSFPMVSAEGLVAALVVDTHEERAVVTVDVVGAYLNALMDNFLAMKLEGKMVDYMVQADPETYSNHIRMEYGKKMLYLRIGKSL